MGQADRSGEERLFADKRNLVNGILDEVRQSLKLGMIKHAPMHSPHEGVSVIREELEELWDHVKADTGRTPEARKEALQVAAMAIRYVVDLIEGERQ